MAHFNVHRNTAHIDLGRLFYLGWDFRGQLNDEAFGISIWDLYLGYYNGQGWSCGILDENGCLPGHF